MKLLDFNLWTLKVFLIWQDDETNDKSALATLKSNIFYFIPIYIGGSTTLYGMLNQILFGFSDIGAFTECTIGLIDSLGGFYMRFCFLRNVQKIKTIIKDLDGFSEFCPVEEILKVEKRVRLFSKVMLLYCLLGNITNSLIPLLDATNCKIRREPALQKRDPCGATSRAYYPFKVSEYPLLQIVYIIQFYSAVIISMCILIITMLLIGIIIHICGQLRWCRKLIKELCHQTEKENIIRVKLRRIIEYHIRIIRFYENTNDAFKQMNLLYMTLTSLVISVLGFEVLMIDNIVDSLRYSLQLFGWIVLLLLVCYYGQLLIDESTELATDLYTTPWYSTSVVIQKDLQMMIMRAQSSLKLSAANIGIMSFPTFLKVMKSAYSYFTLLLQMK